VRWLLTALPALACGAMLLFICVPMLFGGKHRRDEQSASKEEVAALREEVAQLRAGQAQSTRDEHV
jgi:hypothetical protein